MRLLAATLAIWTVAGLASVGAAEGDLNALYARATQLYEKGDYDGATKAAEEALKLAEPTVGKDSDQLAALLDFVAALYEAQGKFASAEPLYARALSIRERVLGPDHPSTASSLNSVAFACVSQGKYEQAEPLYRRSLAISEKTNGPDHAQTAATLRDLAMLYAKQQRFQQALPLAKRALAVREEVLGRDHPDTGIILNELAQLHDVEGEYGLAEPLYVRALAVAEKSAGPDAPETAAILNKLALVYYRQGRYSHAVPLATRALAIREKALGRNHRDTAISINNLAQLHEALGQYEQAESLYQRALAIKEASYGPNHPSTALSLNNLAAVYKSRGRFAEAEPLYKRALKIRETSSGPDSQETAVVLNNLAELYDFQGRYAEAEPLYKGALQISEKARGADHPETASFLHNLAEHYKSSNQLAKAGPLYERSLAIREKSLGTDHPYTASSLNSLAAVYHARRQYTQAEPLVKRSLAIREKSLGPDHPDTAKSLNNLAALHEAQGRYALAEPLYKRSLAIKEKFLGPDHPDTVDGLENLAVLEAARGRFPDASALFDRSRHGTRRHVARVLPALSAAEQSAFLRTQDESRFHAALTLGLRQQEESEIARLSAGWLANGKAVGQEAASQQIILARQSENPATSETVAGLTRVRGDLAKLSQLTPSPDEAADYRAKVAELQKEEHRLVHEIGGQLAVLDRDEPWVEIDEIRKNIPAASVLVDIARFGIFDSAAKRQDTTWQPARYAAWIVPPAGKGAVTIVDLGEAEEIDRLVAAYRTGIKAVSGPKAFARGHFTLENEMRKTASPVAQAVLDPILAAITKKGLEPDEIILSPDGALWLLPWQALPLGDDADSPYAIERFAFRTLTSSRDLVPPPKDVRALDRKPRGPVVVADPSFDAAPPAAPVQMDAPARGLAPAGRRLPRVDRLAATLAEARASARALQRIFPLPPKELTGIAASEENVKKEAVRPPAIVLATHGYVLPDQVAKRDDTASLAGSGTRSSRAVTATGEPIEDPLLRCGLLLAGANLTNAGKTLPGDDGILTGAEIVGLDLLGTDLVVLSACQTGEGQVNTGEGVAGLRQAFQIAGAKSVVATLWTVPDAESAQIMSGFYDNVARGSPPSKALRDAQLAFIKQRREDRNYEAAHPYHWAAYGVTGR